MIKSLIEWLNSLSPLQNVGLGLVIFSIYVIASFVVLAWVEKNAGKIRHIPTEEELRRRDKEGAHRAYLRYTTPREKRNQK